MAQHGGYREPRNPAAVSGPGKYSRRTDGKQPMRDLPDAGYGEGREFRELQQSAPLAEAQRTSPAPAGPPVDLASIVGLGAPTTQPDVPVTSGAEYGAGPGMEALGIRSANALDAEHLRQYLPVLLDVAQRDDTPPGTKRWVRTLIANL